ncbi:MAG: phosphoribosylanthranilate isomerase [Thermodesulfobacteriota bacterium]
MNTWIKICGITSVPDGEIALEAGADALGFVFYKDSARYVTPDEASIIVSIMPPEVAKVGVFVNEPIDTLVSIAKETEIDTLQLHGDEDEAYLEELLRLLPDSRVLKVIKVRDEADIEKIKEFPANTFLLDTFSDISHGGAGETFDWGIALKAKELGRVILAGGLTPDNITDALRTVRPYGVDVSTGVEKSPGKKDREKIKNFIDRIRDFDKAAG